MTGRFDKTTSGLRLRSRFNEGRYEDPICTGRGLGGSGCVSCGAVRKYDIITQIGWLNHIRLEVEAFTAEAASN